MMVRVKYVGKVELHLVGYGSIVPGEIIELSQEGANRLVKRSDFRRTKDELQNTSQESKEAL